VTVYVAPEVAAVCALYGELIGVDAAQRDGTEHLRLLAERLAEGHRRRHHGAFVELSNWHPGLPGRSAEAIWSAVAPPSRPGHILNHRLT
jgi:hypothetical protein